VQAIADLRPEGAEYFTWIFTEHTRVQFDVRGTDAEASLVAARLQSIIESAQIP
jgi:hypothetical protein